MSKHFNPDYGFNQGHEVFTIGVGSCGTQIAKRRWEYICLHNSVDLQGRNIPERESDEIQRARFFKETVYGQFVPKSLFIDSDSGTCDTMLNGSMKNLFNRDYHCAVGKESSGGIYPNGYQFGTHGLVREGDEGIYNRLRMQFENMHAQKNVQIFNSLSGGVGSGTTARVSEWIMDECSKISILNFGVYPSKSFSNNSNVSVYNTLLNIKQSSVHGFRILYDNEGLYNNNIFKGHKPTFKDLNEVIVHTSLSSTCENSSAELSTASTNQILMNIIPFPFLNHAVTAFGICESVGSNIDAMICSTNSYETSVSYNLLNHIFVGCALVFRGFSNPQRIYHAVNNFDRNNDVQFASWVPCRYKIGVYDDASSSEFLKDSFFYDKYNGNLESGCMAGFYNSSIIAEVFSSYATDYDLLNHYECFLHWYSAAGIEKEEFVDAREHIETIIDQYRMIHLIDERV